MQLILSLGNIAHLKLQDQMRLISTVKLIHTFLTPKCAVSMQYVSWAKSTDAMKINFQGSFPQTFIPHSDQWVTFF